jgi:hypothetical protein
MQAKNRTAPGNEGASRAAEYRSGRSVHVGYRRAYEPLCHGEQAARLVLSSTLLACPLASFADPRDFVEVRLHSKILLLVEASPVSRPCQNGEFADRASSSGTWVRNPSATAVAAAGDGMPTWTCSPKIATCSATHLNSSMAGRVRDLLVLPVREGMCAGGGDQRTVFRGRRLRT